MNSAQIVKFATHALNEMKAVDLVTLDIQGLTTLADTMIICSGRSSRHVVSLAESVITEAKRNHISYIRMEGHQEGEWVIADLGDVIVHVMLPATREFYNLEDLWEPISKQRELKQR